MVSTDATLEEMIRTLPPDMRREVEDFVQFLLEKRRRDEREKQKVIAHGWPPGFFEQTAGALADDPTFIRHPQGEYEERENFE